MPSSLDPILRPRSIAVIGASRQANTIGWQILDNLLVHGFTGAVYPVNPKAPAVHSILAYASVKDIPQVPDLAVIAVPKEHVLKVAEECAAIGVKGLIVISAGFKEVGGAGVERERQLLALVKQHGMRMVGPNCMGVINTDPAVRVDATFAPAMPPEGPVAFMSQSGAMGLSVLDYAESYGIGISLFVSAGNKADVSGNDLLEYAGQDKRTTVVLMYLENFGNPARFVEIGRRLTRTMPICVVKSGRTGAGARAAASHTGALAGTELATDAIIAQAGAIRADTVEELFDLAMAFANQPLPKGNRVAIVTNAGGPGIIIADACEAHRLSVTPLAPATERKLQSRLPEEASVRNPVDLIASATAESYEFAIDAVLDDPNVDAVIAAFVPPLGIQTKDVAESIVRVNARHPDKPILAVLMGRQGLPAGLAELHDAKVPAYIFPESAARALGAMWRQRQRASAPEGKHVTFKTDDKAVTTILDATAAAGHAKLSEPDALRVLEAYGIPVVPWTFVSKDGPASLAEATARAAHKLGFPVALKVVSPHIMHKTDVGAVALNLASDAEVSRAVREMVKRVSALPATPPRSNERRARKSRAESVKRPAAAAAPPIDGILVQQMAPKGRETIVGMTRMPGVGPMVMFGLGGVYVEVLRDVVLRLAPLSDADADEMLRGVRTYKLLEGVRGERPRDLQALAQTLLRVSQLTEQHPRIAELDINPLLSLEKGALALDARIQLEAKGSSAAI